MTLRAETVFGSLVNSNKRRLYGRVEFPKYSQLLNSSQKLTLQPQERNSTSTSL